MSLAVERWFGALSRTLGTVDVSDRDLEKRLDELVGVAIQVLDVSGAGLMLLDPESHLRLIGASDDAARMLESSQLDAGAGPGLLSTRTREVVAVSDLNGDGRWPQIASAVAPFGIRSVLSAPLWLGGRPVGNLNLFDSRPRAWTASDCERIGAFAEVAGSMLLLALRAHDQALIAGRLRDQLQAANGAGC